MKSHDLKNQLTQLRNQKYLLEIKIKQLVSMSKRVRLKSCDYDLLQTRISEARVELVPLVQEIDRLVQLDKEQEKELRKFYGELYATKKERKAISELTGKPTQSRKSGDIWYRTVQRNKKSN